MITKGAVEEILKVCQYVELNNEIIPLTPELQKTMEEVSNIFN